MYNFCLYFVLFIIYSVLGWIVETLTCSLLQKKWVKDRGFLMGPYCPIYGTGALAMILFLSQYKHDLLTFFILAIVYASIIEYFVSYLLEKLFKARWWDYTDKKFNVNGRICLSNCVLFGFMGILVVYFVQPFLFNLLSYIPKPYFIAVALVIFVFFLIDIIISFSIISKLKLNLQNIRKDSSSEIADAVNKVLNQNKKQYQHLYNSFPTLEFKFHNKEISLQVKKSLDDLEKKIEHQKQEIKKIKNNIKNLKNQKASKQEIKEEQKKINKIKNVKLKEF